jgi:PAS domain S-box-containing protein
LPARSALDLPTTAGPPTPDGLLACLDAIADGVIIGDLDGNITYWNPAALRLHGYDSLIQVRRHLSQFARTFVLVYPNGDPVPFDQWPFSKLMRGEPVVGFEGVLSRADGRRSSWLQYDGAIVDAGPDGRRQIVLTIHDLTDRRRAEIELQQTQSHFRDLLESLPLLVWTCGGTDGGCDYVGPQLVAFAGVPARRLLGTSWVEWVHPDDRPTIDAGWRDAVAARRSFESECRMRRADGTHRWFKIRALPMRDGSGGAPRWVGTGTDVHDAREAAESLGVLAAIVEHSDDAIVGKSLDGTITSWNRAARRMFGYAAEEAVGRNVMMLLPGDRFHEERDIMARIREGEAVEHFESQRVAKDGREVHVSLTISPVRDADGRVVGASKIARDVTARHAARRELRASHALLHALVEGIIDPVYVKDRDGRYLLGNAALGRVIGRPVGEVIGTTDDQAMGRDWAKVVRAEDRRTMDGNVARTFEESLSVDGVTRHFLTTKAPYHDADGHVAGVLGISRDVTSLKAAEQAVRAGAQHLRGVLDGLLIYVAVLRPDGRVTGMNLALREALVFHGVTPDAIADQPIFDTPLVGVGEESRVALRAALAMAATGKAARLDAVTMAVGPPAVTLDLMFSPMPDADGCVTHVILSAVDVTERERAAEQARERQATLAHMERLRTMGQMATGLAHELTQPFGAIANYAAACRRSLASGRMSEEQLGQTLAEIGSEAARAGAIVHRLHGFVRKQQPQASAIDVNDVVEDGLRLLAFDLRQAGVEVRVALADGLPHVLADAVQVGQVLVNLIRNAIDAMAGVSPDRRRLVLETAIAGPMVRVAVHDVGCGVTPQAMDHIFDAFFTTKPDGLGVGLALCRTIVEEHGGHLSAAPGPAGGMTFAFTLRPTTSASAK